MYEPGITYLIQQGLSKYPDALFMDLGANIGYYSLLAARSGHKTIAGIHIKCPQRLTSYIVAVLPTF